MLSHFNRRSHLGQDRHCAPRLMPAALVPITSNGRLLADGGTEADAGSPAGMLTMSRRGVSSGHDAGVGASWATDERGGWDVAGL